MRMKECTRTEVFMSFEIEGEWLRMMADTSNKAMKGAVNLQNSLITF